MNRVLQKIFEPKRDKATGGWNKIHSEELCDLYSSSNTICEITSRRMKWAGLVARMRDRVLVGTLRERDRLDDLGLMGK